MKQLKRLLLLGGFTLIELLVVLTLVGVLGALAMPSLRDTRINQNLGSAASELMVDAGQARATALRLNRRVIVEPKSGSDWRTGWNVFVELSGDNTYTAGTDTLVFTKEALSSDVQIGTSGCSSEGATACPRIAFDGDGFLASVSGTSSCNVNFSSSAIGRQRCVIAAKSGRVRICDPKTAPGGAC